MPCCSGQGLKSPFAIKFQRRLSQSPAGFGRFILSDEIGCLIEPFPGCRVLLSRKHFKGSIVTADRAGLGFLGFIFGGVTAAVMLVAVTVVIGHVDGRLVLDNSPVRVMASQ